MMILLGCLIVLLTQQCKCDSSEDEDEPLGGVSIKVFRGPSKKVNGRQVFAPFGYYVKMPADVKRKKSENENDDENEQYKENDNDDNFNDGSAEEHDLDDF